MSDDPGLDAHYAAIEHLRACFEALDEQEEAGDSVVESPASAPFCGCEDCVVREVLHAAWPILEASAASVPGAAGSP